MSRLGLTQIKRMMADRGAVSLFAKLLSPNDNSKNQIYLGGSFSALNIFPNLVMSPDATAKGRRTRFKAPLQLWWLDDEGNSHAADSAQLILYPKYPEVRLSGFLKGCRWAPSEIMGSRMRGRVLFLGVANDGAVLACAVTSDSPAAREIRHSVGAPNTGVFAELSLPGAARVMRDGLLRALRRVYRKAWIDSKRLDSRFQVVPCCSPNCGGYTLEAELGVRPNSMAEPDYKGWEIKQFAISRSGNLDSSTITLMTPEPTAGLYREIGTHEFVRRFGYPDRKGRADRINFGGIHRAGSRSSLTGLLLTLDGYDFQRDRITDTSGGVVLKTVDGENAALWGFDSLMRHWTKKHARAAYIPSRMRQRPSRQYRFGPITRIGEGVDFLLLLKGIAEGKVYYDPGIKIEAAGTKQPRLKRRSQFRVRTGDLNTLYESMLDLG